MGYTTAPKGLEDSWKQEERNYPCFHFFLSTDFIWFIYSFLSSTEWKLILSRFRRQFNTYHKMARWHRFRELLWVINTVDESLIYCRLIIYCQLRNWLIPILNTLQSSLYCPLGTRSFVSVFLLIEFSSCLSWWANKWTWLIISTQNLITPTLFKWMSQ